MQEARQVRISGRVQGVYYRASLQEQAMQLGVSGWCRNLPNGDVEALMVASSKALECLLAWCWEGPPNARVDDVVVEVVFVPAEFEQGRAHGFEIRR